MRGNKEPRIFTPPLRELTPETSLGFEVAKFSEQILGIKLHPWQEWLLIHALEIVGDFSGEWHFRFRVVLVLVGRQNGKTTLGAVLSLFFLYALEVGLIIGTAQDLEQAEDTWAMCVEMAQANAELKSEIAHVWYTNGAKRLQLTGGRDYRVRASTRKAGRGKSADLVLLDELREHQNWQAYSALSKTGMAKDNALLWCMSNAGDSTSVVLRHFRQQAHKALGDPDGICTELGEVIAEETIDDETLGLFEWSAEPGADPSSPKTWGQANPSMGYTISERALKSAYATDPKDVFLTECLCQWVTATIAPPFPDNAWEAGFDEDSEIAPEAALFYGVDVSADRERASIAVCGLRPDGDWHVELIAYRHGLGWLQGWFMERATAKPMKVAMQTKGAPVAAFTEILASIDGVEVIPCQGPDVAGWAGRFYDGITACVSTDKDRPTPIRHRPQGALDLAANIATTRPLGDGAWGWDRHKSSDDISPLVAVTVAHGAATQAKVENKKIPSVYQERGVRTV